MSCTELFGFVIKDSLCGLSRNRREVSMLSKINNALQAAADVIAPPCPRVEDLKFYWTQVVTVCQKCQEMTAGPVPAVEETTAPRHLINIFKLLVAEEQENKSVGGPLSPCMELIIQEKILVSLTSYAWTDKPLGIRQHCYMFLTGVLNHIHHSHLQHVQIHKPLQAMIHIICETRASPYESQEIDFLSTLCDKIRQDSSLILLYIQPDAVTSRSLINDSEESTDNREENTQSSYKESEKSKFPLVDAFLNLCHSADCDISSTAHDCLVIIANLKDSCCSETMSKYTLFTHYLASRLVAAVDNIPIDTEPMLLEEVSIQSTRCEEELVISESEGEEEENNPIEEFPGKKVLITFLHWLRYCDQIISVSDGVLGSSVCETLREVFLDGVLRPGLTSHDDDVITFHIALITKIINTIQAPLLVSYVVSWLCEDSDDRDSSISMRDYLMMQCRSPPHHLQIQTLRLIQLLIEKPGGQAVQSLVLNYVASRGYYDTTTAEHQQSSWSDEEDERYKLRDGKDCSPGSTPTSVTLAPPNINKIVKRFLGLVPDDIRSTSQDDYESYKIDAQRQYRDVCRTCASYGWPREAVSPECPSEESSTVSKESTTEADANHFNEGPLLAILMDFLQNLPQQDYDINLQVTSLIATLALLPHPHLHEYLLNPFLPLVGGVRTPHIILRNVVNQIQQPITGHDNFRNQLKMTRFQLLGTMEELEYEKDEEDNHKFEAMIVIEEFSKELASIAYAKYTVEGGEC